MRSANFSAGDRMAHTTKVGIESTIETDLKENSGLVDSLQGMVNAAEFHVNRFFAKDVFSRCRGGFDNGGMSAGWGTNHYCVDILVVNDFLQISSPFGNFKLFCAITGGGAIGIREHQEFCRRNSAAEMFGMQAANPARANQADVKNRIFHDLKNTAQS